MPDRRGLAGRTRTTLVAALGLTAAAVAALVLGAELPGTRAGAASTAKPVGVATVARRDLVETDTESGTLSYADRQTVFNRLSGTITSLPVAGTRVQPGGVLFTVDNAPVVLMNGTLPAYRTLSEGVADGPDVKELEQNLVALGYDSGHAITVDDHFDAATTAGVERWQAAHGQTQTGTVTLGQVVFLPGARRVSTVSAALGSTGGGSGAGATGAALHGVVPRPQFVELTSTTPSETPATTTTTTTTTTTSIAPRTMPGPSGAPGTQTATLLALVALLRAEVAELKAAKGGASLGSGSGRSSTGTGSLTAPSTTSGSGGSRAVSASGGGGAGAATASGGSASAGTASAAGASGTATAQAVLTTTSTQLVATVPLDATKQSEAVLGQPVTVQMPDGSTVAGRIAQVAAAAQTSSSSSTASASGGGGGSSSGSGSSSSASSTVPVTIALRGVRSGVGLDQAAVSVNFEQQKALGVLSVPVTALLATAGGGYAIQPVGASHALIGVTPGLFAAGYVQISGTGVSEGLAVTNSQG